MLYLSVCCDYYQSKLVIIVYGSLCNACMQGSVHCAQFCMDAPYALAVGGEKNGFHIVDVSRLLPGGCSHDNHILLVLKYLIINVRGAVTNY